MYLRARPQIQFVLMATCVNFPVTDALVVFFQPSLYPVFTVSQPHKSQPSDVGPRS